MYSCSKCNLAVIVINGHPIRACKCGDVAVVANMSAQAHGVGGVKA